MITSMPADAQFGTGKIKNKFKIGHVQKHHRAC